MKVLVTGVAGQLRYDVMHELTKRGLSAIGSDIVRKEDVCSAFNYIQLDITNLQAVAYAITEYAPDAVIHCAAWTTVDSAEKDENKDKVFAINVQGTKYIAEACKRQDCKMMYRCILVRTMYLRRR